MRILLTGNKGFVGSRIEKSLDADGHEIVGLEAAPTFREWYDQMCAVMDTPIDAVVHAGAISDNQSTDPNIYLWNGYATYLLAQRVREKTVSAYPIPFVFFSSFLVGSTVNNWEVRTPYTWSKAQGENFVRDCLPDATILRPGVLWGDERGKMYSQCSVPYRLASHNLEYLFTNWARNYVHVDDMVEAVKVCLKGRPKGVFDVITEYVSNKEAASFVEWQGYEWLDNPKEKGFQYISEHHAQNTEPLPPGWTPQVFMAEALPRLEQQISLEIGSEERCVTEHWDRK